MQRGKESSSGQGEKSNYDVDLVTAMAIFPGYLGASIALQSCHDLSQDGQAFVLPCRLIMGHSMKGRAVGTVALKLPQSLKGLSLKVVISFQHWGKKSLIKRGSGQWLTESKRGIYNSQACDVNEVSHPDLGEEDAKLKSGHVNNLGIKAQ